MNYNEIVKNQTDYFNSNQTKDVVFRIKQLVKLKSVVMGYEMALYEAIYSDFKKSEFDTYTTELSFIYHEIDEFINKLPKWAKRRRTKTNLINLPARSYIIPEPLGVCLIIGAWNYPYLLSLSPVVAAIASGNTVVLKPSEIPSATSAIMAKLINENFSPEFMIVVEGGILETTELLKQNFDKIFFTGSSPVGKIIYQAAAKNLTPVTLELGGKSPALVTMNCNLKESAKRLVWAKFLNSGQTCIAPDYILVDEAVKKEFLIHLKDYIRKFEYSFENNNYVQIINERNFYRLIELIDKKKIYYGGEVDLQKRYIAPTILTDVTFDDKVMEDEIFGPILPVISYSDLNHAILEIKYRPKPLACYIFTNDIAIKNKLLKDISFGGGAVNDAMMHITNSNLPFGGIGNSGLGNYHGYAGFIAFSHFKSIIDKPFWLEPNLRYPPNTEKKLTWLKRLMRL
ncbi:MAG: aldehyde dehydrogenase [Bacteroidia bacterium]|nr:aldehyde dehydrogenase [Bacteroidia bacterium]